MRKMLLLALSDAGHTVIQAEDGIHGVEVLSQTPEIDVIITDINMPRMDGYGFIDHVRRDPLVRSTPILVLTTESEPAKRQRAKDAGATGWIVKPFDPAKLIAAVHRVAP
jgi:two-component system chemotaxis response regulator CheY